MIDAEVLALEEINADGRPAGRPAGRVGDRRWPVRLADVRPGGRAVDRDGEGQRDLRLLDLGQPQERQAGGRARTITADLPHGLRGAGAVAQHRLHRRGPQPAGDPRGKLVLREPEGAEVLPRRLGLRVAALRQRDHQGSAQGAGGRGRRRVVRPLRQHEVDGLGRRDQAGRARRDHQHGGGGYQRAVLPQAGGRRASARSGRR